MNENANELEENRMNYLFKLPPHILKKMSKKIPDPRKVNDIFLLDVAIIRFLDLAVNKCAIFLIQ